MTRREAVKVIGIGAAGLALPTGSPRAQTEGESLPMLMRMIPSSGEKLPVIGLGTWEAFDVELTPDTEKQLGDVHSFFAKTGRRVIDSSPMYGRSEQVIGTLAKKLGLTDKLFLATKVWTKGKQAGIEEMERSFARLQTKRIDLMQVHNLVDLETQLATMREWKALGRVQIHRSYTLQFQRLPRGRKSPSERRARFLANQLFDYGTRSRATGSSPGARPKGRGPDQSSVRRRRPV